MLEQSGDGAFQEECEKERKKVCVRRINKTKQKFDFFSKQGLTPSLIFGNYLAFFPTSLLGSEILLVHIILAKHRSSHYVVFNTAVNTEYFIVPTILKYRTNNKLSSFMKFW